MKNLGQMMKQAKEMLLALAEWLEAHNHPFTFSTSVTLNVAKDDEMLRLLRRARFKYFLIGIETPSKEALMAAQKSQNTGFSIAEAVEILGSPVAPLKSRQSRPRGHLRTYLSECIALASWPSTGNAAGRSQ